MRCFKAFFFNLDSENRVNHLKMNDNFDLDSENFSEAPDSEESSEAERSDRRQYNRKAMENKNKKEMKIKLKMDSSEKNGQGDMEAMDIAEEDEMVSKGAEGAIDHVNEGQEVFNKEGVEEEGRKKRKCKISKILASSLFSFPCLSQILSTTP